MRIIKTHAVSSGSPKKVIKRFGRLVTGSVTGEAMWKLFKL